MAREKEIRFSSRTRHTSDALLKLRKERETIRKVVKKIPAALQDDADVVALCAMAEELSGKRRPDDLSRQRLGRRCARL